MHNQKKDNNQFKNSEQAELSENQTPWNSDNPGVKETFIQTGRRGGDGQSGGQDPQQSQTTGKVGVADWKTKDSKPLTVKSWGRGCKGGRNSQSHRRVHWKPGLELSVIVPSLMLPPQCHYAAKSVAPPC